MMSLDGQFDPSLILLNPGNTSSCALVCLPHAGAGVIAFGHWITLGDLASVWIARFPGREKRILEPPLTSVSAMADTLIEPIQRIGAGDIVLFGHCSGALVAYELAHRLTGGSEEAFNQLRLVVSSQPAPFQRPHIGKPVGQWTRKELIQRLRDAGGTPEEVLTHEKYMDLLEPVVRADITATESYVDEPDRSTLGIEVLAIGAHGDPHVPHAVLQEWREVTTGPFTTKILEGSSFFSGGRDEVLVTFMEEYLSK